MKIWSCPRALRLIRARLVVFLHFVLTFCAFSFSFLSFFFDSDSYWTFSFNRVTSIHAISDFHYILKWKKLQSFFTSYLLVVYWSQVTKQDAELILIWLSHLLFLCVYIFYSSRLFRIKKRDSPFPWAVFIVFRKKKRTTGITKLVSR